MSLFFPSYPFYSQTFQAADDDAAATAADDDDDIMGLL